MKDYPRSSSKAIGVSETRRKSYVRYEALMRTYSPVKSQV